MGRVVVFGSLNLDLVAGVEKISSPGETVSGHSFDTFPGGKGANQAMAAHMAGADVVMVGKVGEDAAATQLMDFYHSKNFPTDSIMTTPDAPTGTAVIQVERGSGENSIVIIAGANWVFSNAEIDAVDLQSGDVVVSQLEVPQDKIERLFLRAQACGARTVLNPAPAIEIPFSLLNSVDVLVVNETELSFFAGEALTESSSDLDITKVALQLAVSNQQIILVTLGKRGVLAVQGDKVIRVPARSVTAVDTTGAGDCFVGVLAVQISNNTALEEAIIFANVAASISVQRQGAGPSMPTYVEISAHL